MIKKFSFKVRPVMLKNIFLLAFGPILFIILLGFVFGKIFVEHIPMGILDLDNTSQSRTIVQQFKETSKFDVKYYAKSDEELKNAIKEKKVMAGLIIPHDFSKDAIEMKAPKTILLIDESNMVIGNNALAYGSEILNTINVKIQFTVLQAKNMVPYAAQQSISALSFTERMLYDPQLCYMKYLLYAMIGAVIQQTFIGALSPILIEEKLKLVKMKLRSKEGAKSGIAICAKIILFSALSAVGYTGSMYVAGKYFNLPLKGSLINSYLIFAIFIINMIAVSFVFSAIFDEIDQCVRFSMFLSVPTLLTAGYIWPDYMMPPHFFSVVKKLWPLLYFINPLRTINLKGVGLNAIFPYVKGGIYFGLVWLPIGIGLYLFKVVGIKIVKRKLMKPKTEES